jgi:hypothetical protein
MSIPTGKHSDWPWPFSLIPRRWTAVESDKEPAAVSVLFSDGNGTLQNISPVNPDVPAPGEACISFCRYGVMFSACGFGWLLRIGTFRYDYTDRYYTFPTFTLKRHS